jgi:phosphatidylglycerophosphate synthase
VVTFKKYDKYGYLIKGFDYLSNRFLRFFSIPIARKLSRTNIRPEVVAIFSLILAVLSFILYSFGNRICVLYASLIFFVAWILDCVDGDLARLTSKVSCLGDWLDSTIGKIITILLYSGVCFGLARNNSPSVWVFGFLIISGFYISGMVSYKIKLIKFKKDAFTKDNKNQESSEERSILRTIVREITVGHNLLYYAVIFGGLLNILYEIIVLSAIYIWLFTALTIFNSYRTVRNLS